MANSIVQGAMHLAAIFWLRRVNGAMHARPPHRPHRWRQGGVHNTPPGILHRAAGSIFTAPAPVYVGESRHILRHCVWAPLRLERTGGQGIVQLGAQLRLPSATARLHTAVMQLDVTNLRGDGLRIAHRLFHRREVLRTRQRVPNVQRRPASPRRQRPLGQQVQSLHPPARDGTLHQRNRQQHNNVGSYGGQ